LGDKESLSWESEVRETRVSISFSLPVMKK